MSGRAWAVAISSALITIALQWVPTLGAGAAGVAGFNTGLAHQVLFAAIVAVMIVGALRGDRLGPVATTAPIEGRPATGLAAIVASVILVVYFPPFLSRYGPFGEDRYFFTVIQRMFAGQHPYTDFEFIYGPLLIVPAARLLEAVGYGGSPYYWMVAIVEAVTFAALVLLLSRWIPDRRRLLVAVAVTLVLLLNDNLGLSWLAIRRLLPIVIIAVYAWAGGGRLGAFTTAGLIGVQIVISLEYAAAAILAVGAIGLGETIAGRRWQPVARAVVVGSGGLVVGLGLGWLLLGPGLAGWLKATWEIIVVRGGGEAGFPFQVSVNAWAVVALMVLAGWRVGRGLLSQGSYAAGDRFLVGSLGYAAIAMKSGLARSDMYHLVPPILGLVGVELLRWPAAVFAPAAWERRVAAIAIAAVCLTYAPGLSGAGRSWVEGWFLGARDVITGRGPSPLRPAATRSVRLGAERTEVDSAWVAAAEYFAAPERRARPVVYYGRTWGLDKMIGVPKPEGYYPTDDYLVSDDIGLGIRRYLEAHPTALVVAHQDDWAALRGEAGRPRANAFWLGGDRSALVWFLEYWSSSHFGVATLAEADRKTARWARTVGGYLTETFSPVARIGRWVVLSR